MTEKLNRQQTEAMINMQVWKDPMFRKKLETNPHVALKELGMTKIPDTMKIQIVEEENNQWIIRLHKRPVNYKKIPKETLEKVAVGESQEAKCCSKSPISEI